MRKCPDCGECNFSVTYQHVEVFNRIKEKDGEIYVSEIEEDSFDACEKVIECRRCGWKAPTTDEAEFIRWLQGEEFEDIFDHMSYLGELISLKEETK